MRGRRATKPNPTGEHVSGIELLELDVDVRLADLWAEFSDVEDWNIDVVGALLRAAYAQGYCDALTEDVPGALCREHGALADVLSEPSGADGPHF